MRLRQRGKESKDSRGYKDYKEDNMARFRKIISLALVAALVVVVLGGCSGDKGKKVLVAYFSYADNTVIEETDDMDIDALTAASQISPGNAGLIAEWIHEGVGGDLFSIQVQNPYPADFGECAERVTEELESNARPALKNKVSKIDDYDTIILGYSIWNNACPMAIYTFIETHDLSGKTIAIFSAFGGGGMEDSVSDIKKALPDSCTVLESTFGASREGFGDAQKNTEAWVKELGIKK